MEQEEKVLRRRRKRELVIEESKPYVLCLLCVLLEVGYNIISKVALDNGMSCYVLVFYGHAFGTLATALLAFLFERDNDSKISIPILRNIFFLGLLGAVLTRTLYYVGLKNTSPVFASALGNTSSTSVISLDKKWTKGSFLHFIAFISFSVSFILQTKTVELYPAPMTLTSLTCLVGTFLSAIMAAILDHRAASWKLSWNITLLAAVYSGIVIFGISCYLRNLVLRIRGPVFVTSYGPLCTLLVAIVSMLILGEALHLGSVIGAMLIIIGLYAILWGKKEETEKITLEETVSEQDIETKPEK